MALTCARIVSLATQAAKCPGWTTQAGEMLNAILQDLAMDYDFDAARGSINIPLTSGTKGPYALPTDYLRMRQRESRTELYYVIQGVPYFPIQCTYAEFNAFVFTTGLQNFPQYFATDMSVAVPFTTGPNLYVWPPSNGAYVLLGGYQRQMPDIVTPESATTVPWFPNTNYLWTRLAGELMKIANDDRWEAFLSDNQEQHPAGAGSILRKYLEMKDDGEGMAKTVTLDRRRFNPNYSRLRNTKIIGWSILLPGLLVGDMLLRIAGVMSWMMPNV